MFSNKEEKHFDSNDLWLTFCGRRQKGTGRLQFVTVRCAHLQFQKRQQLIQRIHFVFPDMVGGRKDQLLVLIVQRVPGRMAHDYSLRTWWGS